LAVRQSRLERIAIKAVVVNALLALPEWRRLKRKKKRNLSESSRSEGEFISLPVLSGAISGTPQGQRLCARLSLLTFFGKTKKVSGCRAAPGLVLTE
jgi:hypothetical protein